MRDLLPWRLAMLAMAIVPGYWALENLMLAMGYARQGAALSSFGHKWQDWALWLTIAAMLLMAAVEWLRGKRRDWLHWTAICGVTCRIWLS